MSDETPIGRWIRAGKPEQPDGIDDDSRDTPDPQKAAERVTAWIEQFGDGLCSVEGDQPLYARDMFALVKATHNLHALSHAFELLKAAHEAVKQQSMDSQGELQLKLRELKSLDSARNYRFAQLEKELAATKLANGRFRLRIAELEGKLPVPSPLGESIAEEVKLAADIEKFGWAEVEPGVELGTKPCHSVPCPPHEPTGADPREEDPEDLVREPFLSVHQAALQEIDRIVGNEDGLGESECAQLRRVLARSLGASADVEPTYCPFDCDRCHEHDDCPCPDCTRTRDEIAREEEDLS